jgi:hypothetical protein
MKKGLCLLLLMVAVAISGNAAWADGDFYVIAGGSGGAVGTKITSVPYKILQSGFYYLGGDLTSSSPNGIEVWADNVTIDLMGFTLTGPNTTSGFGIYVNNNNNVEIRNGTVTLFYNGINCYGNNFRIINMRVLNIRYLAISLGNGYAPSYKSINNLVKGCQVCNSELGIRIYGDGVNLMNNEVSRVKYDGIGVMSSLLSGIFYHSSGGNIIGNASCNNGTGFLFQDINDFVIDRNSASGNTTNWSVTGTGLVWGLNAGGAPAP